MCHKILQEQLIKLGLDYNFLDLWQIEIKNKISPEQWCVLNETLALYGIKLTDDIKISLVERTKNAIVEMVYQEEKLPAAKISCYLSEKLNDNYTHIASVFSENAHISIENFMIMKKIERVKQLMINEKHSLTEIAHMLNYSSVHHLSNQFKKHTGLSPSLFQRIFIKRREQSTV